MIAALEGVEVVLCSKIGDCPQDMLRAAGIEATDAQAFDYIESGIAAIYRERFGQDIPLQAIA